MNSIYQGNGLFQFGIFNGAASYQQFESGYDVLPNLAGVGKSSWYGQPTSFQQTRSLRFTLRYNF
jgi:hypothetical protein